MNIQLITRHNITMLHVSWHIIVLIVLQIIQSLYIMFVHTFLSNLFWRSYLYYKQLSWEICKQMNTIYFLIEYKRLTFSSHMWVFSIWFDKDTYIEENYCKTKHLYIIVLRLEYNITGNCAYQSIKYWTLLFIFFLSGSLLYNVFFFGYDLLKLRTKQCSV